MPERKIDLAHLIVTLNVQLLSEMALYYICLMGMIGIGVMGIGGVNPLEERLKKVEDTVTVVLSAITKLMEETAGEDLLLPIIHVMEGDDNTAADTNLHSPHLPKMNDMDLEERVLVPIGSRWQTFSRTSSPWIWL